MFALNHKSKSVANASILLFIFGIIAKIIGLLREIIYANNFGLSKEYDLFLTIAAIPVVINSMMLYLSQHYFIPIYNKLSDVKSNDDSYLTKNDFFNYSFWWFTIFGIIVALVLYIFAKIIFNSYLNFLSSEIFEKGILIFYLLLITIPLNASISIISAYMQANFNFILPVISQLILNIILILLTIFFTNLLDIFILPVSYVIAYLISFLSLLVFVYPKLKFAKSLIFKSRFKKSDFSIFISLIFIETLSLSYVITDRYFIGQVPEGGIAALNYAMIIYLLPYTIFSLPLINVIFSKFSEVVSKTSVSLSNTFLDSSRINIFVMVPVIILIFFWGDLFLRILYERGKFTSSDTLMTFQVLQNYCLSLIFFSNYLISVKLLYSINEYKKVLLFSILALAMKIGLNFILVDKLEQNGLALSTSFIYLLLFISGYYFSNKLLKIENKLFHFNSIIYFLLNGLISYILSNQLIKIISFNSIIDQFVAVILFIIFYIINSSLLFDKEFITIKKELLKLLPLRNSSEDTIILKKEF